MILADDVITNLHDAIVKLGMDRIALVAGIDGSFVQTIPIAASQSAQVLVDLHQLNRVDRLSDGSTPLRLYLLNASRLAKQRKERAIIIKALSSVNSCQSFNSAETDEGSTGTRKRQRDVETLHSLLVTIHLPTMDEFFERIQLGIIPREVLHFRDSFNNLVSSSLFHVHDPTLAVLVSGLHEAWNEATSFGDHFSRSVTGQYYSFITSETQEHRDIWRKIQAAAQLTRERLGTFLTYVRENYVEVDVERMTNEAWVTYQELQKRLRKQWSPRARKKAG